MNPFYIYIRERKIEKSQAKGGGKMWDSPLSLFMEKFLPPPEKGLLLQTTNVQ